MLRYALLNPSKQALEVVVRHKGRARKIVLRWMTKEAQPEPPEDWAKQVYSECAFQESSERKAQLWPK